MTSGPPTMIDRVVRCLCRLAPVGSGLDDPADIASTIGAAAAAMHQSRGRAASTGVVLVELAGVAWAALNARRGRDVPITAGVPPFSPRSRQFMVIDDVRHAARRLRGSAPTAALA